MRRLIFAVLAVLVAIAAAAGVIYSRVDRPFKGYTAAEQFVEVPPGAGPAAIGRRLVESGVVRDGLTWRIAVFKSGEARVLKAGEYRFTGELRPADVIAKLARGDVYLRPMTFPEGLTIQEMAKLFESRGFGAAASFEAAARNAEAGGRARPRGARPRGVPVSGDVSPAAPRERRRARARDGARASSRSSAPTCGRPPPPAASPCARS